MNKYSPPKKSGSLLERAGEIYDYIPAVRTGEQRENPLQRSDIDSSARRVTPVRHGPVEAYDGPTVIVDREKLKDAGFIVPDGPVTGISEEFRIIKRQLLLAAKGSQKMAPIPRGERILICSAHPDEGKTFCALNLALSIAAEKDNEVLLVDADFAKPSILSSLGLEGSKGLMDALADPQLPVENCIIHTDIPGLAILPAGDQTNADTEYLASSRTEQVLNRLTQNNPNRIVIFDSPPALSASPASVLAMHVGQVLMVVKADETTETALRDALSLLGGCDHIQLLLNGTKFSPTGRRFGSYYGYGE
ncbi:AAA family ATPase [Sphingorhabdus sp. 109]|jgi:exopolysaccharide/PEP-CTERM locus tyrosine autokinase|uniref:AAA family ATPase n=1 Tax=Sphingorhabdus sp. 109 TaxID=2653173 RepID=UPI0012EFEC12|nr:AAA family ATPase [Sphingorhabdus sp. 109]VWX56903.1 putative tyrosine-protein kinase YveL [Sphingorhabdus sp. 109]